MSWKDDAKKRMKQLGQGKTFKFGTGDTTFRLLPSHDAVKWFVKTKKKNGKASWKDACSKFPPFIEFMACRDVGPEKKFVRSGKDVNGNGECWLVDTLIPALEASNSKADREKAKAMQPEEQFIVQVAWLDGKEWLGPAFLYVPKSLRYSMLQKITSPRRQYDNPVSGFNLTVSRSGTGFDTRYGSIEPDDEHTPVPSEILKRIKPFSDICPDYSEDDQKEAWGDDLPEGADDIDSDDDDEFDSEPEEKPKKKRGRPKGSKNKKKKEEKKEEKPDDEFDEDDDSSSDDDSFDDDLGDGDDPESDDDSDLDTDDSENSDDDDDGSFDDDDVPF